MSGAASRITSLRVQRVGDQPWRERTPEGEETLLVLLSGTFDLQAGGGAWASRGLRSTPYAGRPCGLYLPPATEVTVSGGSGEVLLVSARLPEPAAAPGDAPERAAKEEKRPLLPLAGQWQVLERLPEFPEAMLPRHIERLAAEGATVERIFPRAYKARVLCLDEAVLQEGAELALPLDGPDPAADLAVLARTEGRVRVGADEIEGEGVVRAGPGTRLTAKALAGRAYLAIVRAGPKG